MGLEVIKKFSDNINNLDPSSIGGKAFSLAGLYQKGFAVPDGFIITVHAFDHILSQICGEEDQYKIRPEEIQQKIIEGDMPLELAETINRSFDFLNAEFVAVRSSASFEDGERHSCAGQFESFLEVGKEDLLLKVKFCWASVFAPRAISYAKIANETGKMAVIVQRMVEADISGVCFSVNPVTHDRKTVVIESILGLGEKLVQGVVTPDRFMVCKETLIIKEKHVSMNETINDNALKKIAQVVIDIEKLYNKPVDVEWALKSGKLYILQTRPITTLQRTDGLVR